MIVNKLTKLFAITLILGLLFMASDTHQDQHVVPRAPRIHELSKYQLAQIKCMAKNIFYEASGESLLGQAAVARVVMNRIAYGFANNPCNVIYQKTITTDGRLICQFSWVCANKADPKLNSYSYMLAEQVAYDVVILNKHKEVLPKSTLFFHSIHIDPLWPYKQVAIIGGHIFYSKVKNEKNKQ